MIEEVFLVIIITIVEFLHWRSCRKLASKTDLEEMEKRMAKSQAEVVQELQELKTKVGKVTTEVVDATTELKATIKKLEDIIAAGNTGQATPELEAVVAELNAEFRTLDDLHLDKEPPIEG